MYNGEVLIKNLMELTETKTQDELAYKLNTTSSTISNWKHEDKIPNMEKLVKWSEKYNCSIDWLIGNNVEKPKKELSVRDICKMIVDIDTVLPFDVLEHSEWVDTDCELADRRRIKGLSARSACNYGRTELVYHALYFKDLKYDFDFTADHVSPIATDAGNEINIFIDRYLRLKQAYNGKILDKVLLNQSIANCLAELSAEPITYTEEGYDIYGSLYDPETTDELNARLEAEAEYAANRDNY
jgi:transcriptional regulator with XRE-family HTH domain